MDEHKKKILMLVGAVIVLIALLAILLSIIFKDENKNKPINKPGNNNVDKVISKEITLLDDESLYFAVQNTINSYYNMLANKNTEDLMKILDDEILKEKQINSNNIYNIIESDYETVNFIAKSIYYNPNSDITYYFINGYLVNSTMMEDDFQYYKSVNFLIFVDESTKYYNILPLDNNINISSFATSYNIKDKYISSNVVFSNYTMSEENKLSVYITEFLNLMAYDSERAFSMLDDETKKKYQNKEYFDDQFMNIYDMLSAKIFSYSIKENKEEKVYSIIDDKQNKITIYEKNIMNYKIGF